MSNKAIAEFESFVSSQGLSTAIHNDLYRSQIVGIMWKTWLAAKEKYEPRGCAWSYDEDTDSYDTQCGGKFQTITDSIEDNGIDFCCYCGGEIQDAPSTQGEE